MSRHPGGRAGRKAALLAVVIAGLVGCGGGGTGGAEGGTPALTRERFVAVVVALRKAEIELQHADSPAAEFAVRRDRILAEHGVTEEDLREYVRAHGEVDLLEETWDTILQRLKYVPPRYDPRAVPPDPDTGRAAGAGGSIEMEESAPDTASPQDPAGGDGPGTPSAGDAPAVPGGGDTGVPSPGESLLAAPHGPGS